MRIPTEVKIGPHTFEVKHINASEALAHGVHGEFSDVETCIRINVDRSPSRVIDTLMHEVLHGIWCVYHLDDSEEEEHCVSVLSTALVQL